MTLAATGPGAGPRLRVLIVDDHPMMRRGLRGVLESEADIEVIAEASDGFEAIDAYREHLPDVTLMDLAMPRCGGIEAIREIRASFPDARILALTTYAGDGQIVRALDAGATGYVLKSAIQEDAAGIVRSAYAGSKVLAPELEQIVAAGRMQQLTTRERDVLALVARGFSNRRTADRLGIGEETVKGYLSNIMQKLHASDRTHAVVIALQRGMLD